MKKLNELKEIIESMESELFDSESLKYFIECYYDQDRMVELQDIEDYISEHIDSNSPIYHSDIIDTWQKNYDINGKTIDVVGQYNKDASIMEMMSSDIFFYEEEKLTNDFNLLLAKIEELEGPQNE